ncbi:MAG: DinB family protein [Thermomicrobiales bacterium]|nr:DinB family protein [Thermomicrobiales bacterium]
MTTAEPARNLLAITPVKANDATIARWLGAIENSRRRTLDLLCDINPVAIDWQRDGENTIGTLLYHIAAIEADWLYCEVLTQPFPEDVVALFPWDVRDAAGRLSHVAGRSIDEHVELLAAIRTRLLAAFQPMTLSDFQTLRVLPDYDVSPEWVLHHLMQHEAEHRGQIDLTLTAFAADVGQQ